jgi:hypothetical protein
VAAKTNRPLFLGYGILTYIAKARWLSEFGKSSDAAHFGDLGEVLLEVAFVYEQLVNSWFFRGRSVVLLFSCCSHAELGLEPFFLAFSSSFRMRRLSLWSALASRMAAARSSHWLTKKHSSRASGLRCRDGYYERPSRPAASGR